MSTYTPIRRSYYERNRELVIQRSKEYKKTHIPKHYRDLNSRLKYLLTKSQKRKWKNDLDVDYLLEIWNIQKGLCVYTGLPLLFEANHPEAVSIDRINSEIGYLKGNIQLVCNAVNKMKQELSEESFLRFCSLITDNRIKTTQ